MGALPIKVRAHEVWTAPLPDGIDPVKAGPLFCGGITVFNPIIQLGLQPTDSVGGIGIGGLGHMALKFLQAWGCEVTAFSSSAAKTDEAKAMGANHGVNVVNSRDPEALKAIAGSPLGSPASTQKMLHFAQRHSIEPVIETYPFSQINKVVGLPKHNL